jgi:hypothetical protein
MLRWTTRMGMLETSGAISRTLWGLVLLIPTPKSPNGSKIINTVLPPTYHPATQPKNRKSTLKVIYAVSCSISNACTPLRTCWLPPIRCTAPTWIRAKAVPATVWHSIEVISIQRKLGADWGGQAREISRWWSYRDSLRFNQLHQQKIPQILVDGSNQPPTGGILMFIAKTRPNFLVHWYPTQSQLGFFARHGNPCRQYDQVMTRWQIAGGAEARILLHKTACWLHSTLAVHISGEKFPEVLSAQTKHTKTCP